MASFRVGREAVRRWLYRENLVWRRPRPVLDPEDPERQTIPRTPRFLLRNLPSDQIAVFQTRRTGTPIRRLNTPPAPYRDIDFKVGIGGNSREKVA